MCRTRNIVDIGIQDPHSISSLWQFNTFKFYYHDVEEIRVSTIPLILKVNLKYHRLLQYKKTVTHCETKEINLLATTGMLNIIHHRQKIPLTLRSIQRYHLHNAPASYPLRQTTNHSLVETSQVILSIPTWCWIELSSK